MKSIFISFFFVCLTQANDIKSSFLFATGVWQVPCLSNPKSMFREDWEKVLFRIWRIFSDWMNCQIMMSQHRRMCASDGNSSSRIILLTVTQNHLKTVKPIDHLLLIIATRLWVWTLLRFITTPIWVSFLLAMQSRSVRIYDRSLQLVRAFEADKVPCDFELVGDRLYVCSHQSLDRLMVIRERWALSMNRDWENTSRY